jgi:hypothetical protein
MLGFLEKIAFGFWDIIRRIVGLVFPFLSSTRELRRFGFVLRWLLHIGLLVGTLVGLWFLDWYLDLPKYLRGPRWIRDNHLWAPLIFLLLYVLSWLTYWIWKLLRPEAETAEFPDIDQAWDEATRALHQAGIDVSEAPLFLVLGKAQGGELALFEGTQMTFPVKYAPPRDDAPLHVFGSRDAIFVTCAGASLLGKQADILAGEATPGLNGSVGIPGIGQADPGATLKPEGRMLDVQSVLTRARESGRDPSQLTEQEKQEIRVLLAEHKAEEVEQVFKARPNLLKDTLTAGRLSARLGYLCRLIVRDRYPFCPVNGMLVLVPFAGTDSDNDANQTGNICHQDLETARRVLQIHCPVFTLVCDLETTPGFPEFAQRFAAEQRARRIGQRFPLVPDVANQEALAHELEQVALAICNNVFPSWVYKLFRVETPGREETAAVVKANTRLFNLMSQFRDRRKRFGQALTRCLEAEGESDRWLFGGCYVAGTGREAVREQAFVAGVFRRLMDEQNAVAWTPNAHQQEQQYRQWTKYGYVGIAVCTAALVTAGIFLKDKIFPQ